MGMVLAASAAYFVWNNVGPTYQASGSTVLIPPKSTVQSSNPNGRDANPLLYLGELGQARDVLISAMASDEVQADFSQNVPGASYSVSADPMSNGPIILYAVSAPSADVAVAGARYLGEQVDARFSAVQAALGVYGDTMIRTMPLTEAGTATADSKAQVRSTLVVGAGVLLLCVFLVALVDGLASARRRRRAGRGARAAVDDLEPSTAQLGEDSGSDEGDSQRAQDADVKETESPAEAADSEEAESPRVENADSGTPAAAASAESGRRRRRRKRSRHSAPAPEPTPEHVDIVEPADAEDMSPEPSSEAEAGEVAMIDGEDPRTADDHDVHFSMQHS
ncbi:MAG: hypothetical protein KDB60_00560 [Propionibacteriaceae bacterium]|nr:hypothetical protein [Propionibacteriaceae bacterium]